MTPGFFRIAGNLLGAGSASVLSFQTRVEYLDYIVSPGCLHFSSKTCTNVQSMQPPTKATQLRTFLGLCNLDLGFVYNFEGIAATLTNKLRKDNRNVVPDMNETEMNSF